MSIAEDAAVRRVQVDDEVYISLEDLLEVVQVIRTREECREVAESLLLALMLLV